MTVSRYFAQNFNVEVSFSLKDKELALVVPKISHVRTSNIKFIAIAIEVCIVFETDIFAFF